MWWLKFSLKHKVIVIIRNRPPHILFAALTRKCQTDEAVKMPYSIADVMAL
jgi:hypothetical protein